MKRTTEIILLVAFLLLLQGAVPLFVSKVKAEQNQALDYSGNSCLSLPYNSTITGAYVAFGQSSIYKADQFTVEAWVKPTYDIHAGSDSSYGHNWGPIAITSYYSGGYAYGGWMLLFDYGGGMLHFYIHYASYSWVDYHMNRAFWNSSLWYHVAVTYNPTLSENNLVFYVNGDFDVQYNETHALYYDPNAPLQVGWEGSMTTVIQYGGLIDEFRYWNVSRTTAEIQNSWNRILSNAETANPNLVGYWRFDDGSGIYAQDSSLYGNIGTLLNGPQWITPGAPIVPEFSSILLVLVLAATTSISAILLKRRLRKLNRPSFSEQPKLQ